ncbi:MAG: hypothetical protein M3P98_04205 [bacterium]|nr:hypothetical protein [bacterium]
MKFKLEIKMDNAAFEGFNGNQLAYILERLARKLDGYDFADGEGSTLLDTNGNTVGGWEVTK